MKLPQLLCLALVVSGRVEALETIQTPRSIVVAGPTAGAIASSLAQTIEADRDRVALDLGRDWDGITEVRVAGDELEFRALLPEGRAVPRWATGVAFPSENLVVVQAGGQNVREILRHELSHIGVGRLARSPVPRWFLEGLASVREDAPWTREGVSLLWAARTGQLHPFSTLEASFPLGRLDAELAYAQSADFVQYLTETAGPAAPRDIVRAVIEGRPFDEAVLRTTGASVATHELNWRRSLVRWDTLWRLISNPAALWGALALFVVFAFFSLRRSRQLQLELMELRTQEEELSLMRLADSFDVPTMPDDDLPGVLWEEEEESERMTSTPPKKPTLH